MRFEHSALAKASQKRVSSYNANPLRYDDHARVSLCWMKSVKWKGIVRWS